MFGVTDRYDRGASGTLTVGNRSYTRVEREPPTCRALAENPLSGDGPRNSRRPDNSAYYACRPEDRPCDASGAAQEKAHGYVNSDAAQPTNLLARSPKLPVERSAHHSLEITAGQRFGEGLLLYLLPCLAKRGDGGVPTDTGY